MQDSIEQLLINVGEEMNTRDFVFELGIEEIPAQYVKTMADSFQSNLRSALEELHIRFEKMQIFYTPRRLVAYVSAMADYQDDVVQLIKGPAAKVAFEQDGITPSRALQGFLRKIAKDVSDVTIRSDGKADYVYVNSTKSGVSVEEALPGPLAEVVHRIYQPNPMRWASFKMRFVRPVRWVLCMYGDKVIPVSLECACGGNVTIGNRALSDNPIVIPAAENYFRIMEENSVIVDLEDRKTHILQQLQQIEHAYGVDVDKDSTLLEEICNLVEYPTCAVSHFEEDYLAMPDVIIQTPMKTQQRYFPIYKDGKMCNGFVVVRNGNDKYIDNVIKGNERVLRSRLADAQFFYDEDKKTTLAEKAAQLENVVFITKAGSYADKITRVKVIASRLAQKVGFANVDELCTAITLMKADLVSSVVREYTEIQGTMGGVFARNDGYNEDICTAISEQYLPTFYGDRLPSTEMSAILAISDKLDTIMSLVAVNLKPSGSADPYGTRRQILGILATMLAYHFDVNLDAFIQECTDLYEAMYQAEGETKDSFTQFLSSFFVQRLKVFLIDEKGYSAEDVAKISINSINIYRSINKANAIHNVAATDWYQEFERIFNRVAKLIKNNATESRFSGEISDPEADKMFRCYCDIRGQIAEKIKVQNYEEAIVSVAQFGREIDTFMSENLALCEDETRKNNRIAFFQDFCALCSEIISIN